MTKRHFWLFSHPHSAWRAGWRTMKWGGTESALNGPASSQHPERMLMMYQCIACTGRPWQSTLGVGRGVQANLFVPGPRAADAE